MGLPLLDRVLTTYRAEGSARRPPMSKSASLRVGDWRSIMALIGDCRDLGDDAIGWREHALSSLARLIDAELGLMGEMAVGRPRPPKDLGVVPFGWQTGFVERRVFDDYFEAFNREPTSCAPTLFENLGRFERADGFCKRRTDLRSDREWYASREYELGPRAFGADHILWSFESIPRAPDAAFGLVLFRGSRRRDFTPRELRMARETSVALASLHGRALARFSEPSPRGLPPRARQVLACLLEGDGDKRIACRLRLSPHTVNQYVKQIFRHFGASGRSELLARWIRRGRGGGAPWADG